MNYNETSLNRPALGPDKNGWFKGLAGFVRLLLQRNILNGLEKSVNIQGGPVF
jgi:hypothetical protein